MVLDPPDWYTHACTELEWEYSSGRIGYDDYVQALEELNDRLAEEMM